MFTIKELIEATQGQLIQQGHAPRVKRVWTDTRSLKPGDCFVAIKGETFDGHDFIKEAIKVGVVAVIVAQEVDVPKMVTVIKVGHTIEAYGNIAHYHRQRFNIPVIALTGSAGKTTTKELVARVLKQKYRVLATEGNFNNHMGVPHTLLRLRKSHEVAVIECGTNQPGDIAYLSRLVSPTMVMIISIGAAHLEKLKTLSGVLKEKWSLTKFLSKGGEVIINGDDPYLIKKKHSQLIKVGLLPKNDVQAVGLRVDHQGHTHFHVKRQCYVLRSAVRAHVTNALLAITAGQLLKVPVGSIIKGIQSFQLTAGRGALIMSRGVKFIDDTYNANPLSMKAGIEVLAQWPLAKRRILVMGDMLELGADEIKWHQDLGVWINQWSLDMVVTIGHRSRQTAVMIKNTPVVKSFDNTQQAAEFLNQGLKARDVVLVKGSRSMRMENIIHQWQNKG